MIRQTFLSLLACFAVLTLRAESVREKILLDDNWQFSFGHASSPADDFMCGTEYFNYLTKVNSIHNEGPYSPKFDASKWSNEWTTVDLPHDWVVDLPFAAEASHSHGYKTVGYKYPATSVGWYRRTFNVSEADFGKHISLQFDGIFRNSQVWVNGFYLGSEPSGYAAQVYDISEYLNYGSENLVCVRVDASLEEGWFYEGAGIYRHVWLTKAAGLSVSPFGVGVSVVFPDKPSYEKARVSVSACVVNSTLNEAEFTVSQQIVSPEGKVVAQSTSSPTTLKGKAEQEVVLTLEVESPKLWSCDNPQLYNVVTQVVSEGVVVDEVTTRTGLRDVEFTADKGFFLNGESVKLKGVNMHQDHAGVGSAMPDALQVWRLKQLRQLGCNAYRSSHNPMTPETLDACDSLGILVVEETRLIGINDEHLRLLKRMIDRDRNHPSVILWSIGNEEWGIEWDVKGERLAAAMCEYAHRMDSTRLVTVATSGGPEIVKPVDVAGYNYIMQNPVEEHRRNFPERIAVGTEETSGCGTRGVYFDDQEGLMPALNRQPDPKDGKLNMIERGWQFYDEREWLAGLFYWTGFDYRGEPNPLSFPATGSEFGILDYCGFPKDEAYYLRSWWTDEPVLHILPHWNLAGHEGDTVSVWVYSNCDEVELSVNGQNLGRQAMPKGGHLEWSTVYKAGKLRAVGYKNGKRLLTEEVATTGEAQKIVASPDRTVISADGRDLAVVTVELRDAKGRFVPTACNALKISVEGSARILGVGNGASNFRAKERPTGDDRQHFEVEAFNGLAQVLIQSDGTSGKASVTIAADGLTSATIALDCK